MWDSGSERISKFFTGATSHLLTISHSLTIFYAK